MISYVVIVLVALFAACGGGSPEPVSRNFDGVWLGQALVQPTNAWEFSYEMILSSAVASDTTVVFDAMCPGFDGQMIARGDGARVEWEGTMTCAPYSTPMCEATTLTFTGAIFTLGTVGLQTEMRGTVSGCGVSDTPFTLAYNGE